MAGERTLPGGAQLEGYWTPASDGWEGDGGVDGNWRKIGAGLTSALVVKSQTVVLPGSPSLGDIYIVKSDDGTNPNKVAVWDGPAASEVWTYYPPFEGLEAWVKDTGIKMRYNGSAWAEIASGAIPILQVGRSSNQSCAHNTNTLISPNVETMDDLGVWDVGTNPTRLPALGTGRHELIINLRFDQTAANIAYQLWVTKNRAGSTAYNIDFVDLNEENNLSNYANIRRGVQGHGVIDLLNTDYVEVLLYQFSSDSAAKQLNNRTRITMKFLG